jgi:hypothetical protein
MPEKASKLPEHPPGARPIDRFKLRCDNITSLAFNGCNLELAATQCNCFAHIVFDHGSGHDS